VRARQCPAADRQFRACSYPAEHTQSPERVPPARLAHRLIEGEGERLVVRVIEEPSAVALPAALDDLQGIADACIGWGTGGSEVVERTQDVVVVAGREGEFQEPRIRDLTGRAPPEETALKQVLLASLSGRRDLRHDLRRGPKRALVLEQPLQHADRCMEGRARTLRRFAIPTAVIELLADQAARQALRRAPEAGAKRQRAPVDAGLHLSFEERLAAELLVPPEARLEACHRRGDGRIGAVHAGRT
jgi:hypothetical protein